MNCLLLESTRLLLIHGYIYSYSSAHVQHQSAATFKILIKSSVPFLYFAFTAVPCSKYALRRWGSLLRNSITAPSALSPHETTNSTILFNNEHPIRHARLNECHWQNHSLILTSWQPRNATLYNDGALRKQPGPQGLFYPEGQWLLQQLHGDLQRSLMSQYPEWLGNGAPHGLCLRSLDGCRRKPGPSVFDNSPSSAVH